MNTTSNQFFSTLDDLLSKQDDQSHKGLLVASDSRCGILAVWDCKFQIDYYVVYDYPGGKMTTDLIETHTIPPSSFSRIKNVAQERINDFVESGQTSFNYPHNTQDTQ